MRTGVSVSRKAKCFHQIQPRQEFIGGVDSHQVLARDVHQMRQARAGAEENSLKTFREQFFHGVSLPHDDVFAKFHSHRPQPVNFLADDFPRQTEIRNAVSQHAAQLVQGFKDRHAITIPHQVIRRNQGCRTAANQSDTRTLRWGGGGRRGGFHLSMLVRRKAFERTNRHRLELFSQQAGFSRRTIRAGRPGRRFPGKGLSSLIFWKAASNCPCAIKSMKLLTLM